MVHKENTALIIMASGKATRFGGFPKAFCKVNGEYNVLRTAKIFNGFCDKKYLVVNNDTYSRYKKEHLCCEMFPIITGHGEAHSLLKALKELRGKSSNIEYCVVCWGDAVFRDEKPVKEFVDTIDCFEDNEIGIVACAEDYNPYAWFDVDDCNIIKSHFAINDGKINRGIHDQSMFFFSYKNIVEALERYSEKLGLNDCRYDFKDIKEMKLLYAFDYFYDLGTPMRYSVIKSGNILSFNNKEEFDRICQMMT